METGSGQIAVHQWINLKPQDPHAWEQLAYLQANRDAVSEAITSLKHAQELRETAARWRNLNRLHRLRDDYESAASAGRREVELSPDDPDAWFWLAVAHHYLKEGDLAHQAYITAASKPGATDYHWLWAARSARELDDTAASANAEERLRRCIELFPRNHSCRCDLGTLLVEQGRTEDAREQFEAALVFQSDCAVAISGMVWCSLHRESFEESRRIGAASEWLDRLGLIHPEHAARLREFLQSGTDFQWPEEYDCSEP
jgi:tetratricopeptide (TPR) repeat protein